jgi:hypothetical protein
MADTDPSRGLWKRFLLLAFTALLPLIAQAQTLTPPEPVPNPAPAVTPPATVTPQAPAPASAPGAQPQAATTTNSAAIEQLSQSNRELLDLLKKYLGVLEDMQYDRRLQSRQIQNLEIRLTETLQQNADLQAKIAKLQTELNAPPPSVPATNPVTNTPPPVPPAPPPEPASYLPPAPIEGPPGVKCWHRIYALTGTDNDTSDPFHIEGSNWRVVWHNQDKAGDVYKGTSALFINAFAKGDTIPQKACAKVGSGGDSSELTGPGDFVLKIEASGGKWELAVEDFY